MKQVYRYYCIYRPPMPGTIPRGTVNIVDFGEKVQVPEIRRGAWGYADYERKLEPHEVFRYELIGGNAVDNVIPQ